MSKISQIKIQNGKLHRNGFFNSSGSRKRKCGVTKFTSRKKQNALPKNLRWVCCLVRRKAGCKVFGIRITCILLRNFPKRLNSTLVAKVFYASIHFMHPSWFGHIQLMFIHKNFHLYVWLHNSYFEFSVFFFKLRSPEKYYN
mgnify:CR=1 FL=1